MTRIFQKMAVLSKEEMVYKLGVGFLICIERKKENEKKKEKRN